MFKDRFFGVQQLLLGPEDVLGEGITPDEPIDDEDDKEIEEEEETEDEDKDEDKEDEEEESPSSRFTLEELKGAFKDKPELYKQAKHAFFREQKFTEMFPTVEEAQRAVDAQLAYEEITNAVIEGDASKFVTELKKESSDGLEKFAKNFVSTIFESDRDLYLDIAEPIVKQFLKRAHDHGKTLSDETARKQVIAAAKIIRKTIFGGEYDDIEQEVSLIDKDRKGSEKDDKREAEDGQRYLALFNDVKNVCYSKLDEEINKGLKDLDKTKPGLKKILAKDIRNTILEEMSKDTNYNSRMGSLWQREKRAGYNGNLKSSLLATFLGKAKVLIPKTRASARREVLGKEDVGDKEEPTRLVGNRESKNSSKKMTPERAKAEGLSTLDILSGGKKS